MALLLGVTAAAVAGAAAALTRFSLMPLLESLRAAMGHLSKIITLSATEPPNLLAAGY